MDIRDMSLSDGERIVEEIRQYLSSPKGRKELIRALERADEACERMRKASRIRGDEPFLCEPMISRVGG